jgi:hypothetical protein
MSSADIKRIADLIIKYRDKIGQSKAAIVISKDVTFGMARMFQVFVEQSSIDIAIFRNMEEALRWLGVIK